VRQGGGKLALKTDVSTLQYSVALWQPSVIPQALLALNQNKKAAGFPATFFTFSLR
jgi:hypothetical protein